MGEGHQVVISSAFLPHLHGCAFSHIVNCGHCLLSDEPDAIAAAILLYVGSLALEGLHTIKLNENCDNEHVRPLLQG